MGSLGARIRSGAVRKVPIHIKYMDVTLTRRITPAVQQTDFRPLQLDALIAETRFLPAAFELLPRLLLLLDDPEANCEDLAEVIRVDPGLTANLLKISNSVSFGGARRTSSLSE